MKKLLVVGVVVLSLIFGCAGLQVKGEYTLESLVERSRSCEPDVNGWGVLSVPDKDYANTNLEFIFFTKNEDWGVGVVMQGAAPASFALIYSKAMDSWLFVQNGAVAQITPEEAKETLKAFWEIAKVNMDLDKMGTFKLQATPTIKGEV